LERKGEKSKRTQKQHSHYSGGADRLSESSGTLAVSLATPVMADAAAAAGTAAAAACLMCIYKK
jgi:hypothetical protein